MRKREKKISFWATEAERKRIKRLAAKTGPGEGEYLRLSALGKTIYQVEELKPILRELKGVGRNLNQLTVLSHEGRIATPNLEATLGCLERVYEAINGLFAESYGMICGGGQTGEETLHGDG